MPDNTTRAPLISALLQPEMHGAADTQLIETHISWVVLAGGFAYKIKKPVNLGFLDFSTLEKRSFYCAEELRLNRRLAPEIYLETVAITGTPEHPSFNGSGPMIEYAVKMRRFDQNRLLSRLLEQGQLTAPRIDRLANEVARFHATIPVADNASPFGTPESVLEPALENFSQIRPLLTAADDIARLETSRSWTENEFKKRRQDFIARKAGGFVRECHGDMHTGNMVLTNEAITIFDCIEFNPNLRWIDVMSEAAFVVMDLMERGRADFAWRFLNAYLSISGDYAGLAVLRFYLAYRAMVRAKVSAIRASQSKSPEDWEEYGNYIGLAETLREPAPPVLIITHGLSGSGKTTLTQPLLEALGAIRIRSDVERKRLFGLSAHQKSGSGVSTGLYTKQASGQTYERLEHLSKLILTAGYPVIVDATFLEQPWRATFRELAEEMRIPFAILDFQATEDSLRNRIAERAARGSDASEATFQVLEHQLATQHPLSEDETAYAIKIDTEATSFASNILKEQLVALHTAHGE